MPLAKPHLVALATPDDTEQQFYEALQQADLDKLMAVWSDDDDIVCVHPGGQRLLGAAAIRASFEKLFAHGPINAHPQGVRRVLSATSALHSVIERVHGPRAPEPQTSWVLATNVYVKTPQGWRMAAHHASPGSPRDLNDAPEASNTLH